MKMNCKRNLLVLAACVLGFNSSMLANDLIVAENGAGGAHSTITDALTAAASGDRIFVIPKSGDAAYAENLTIDKSVQILSGKEGEKFTVQGTISVSPEIGRSITITGLKNIQGGISALSASPSGARTNVNILNCNFLDGSINFDYDNFNVTLASSIVKGRVLIRYGKIIGNEISNKVSSNTVVINPDAAVTNDTISIIANKITVNYYTTGSTSDNYGIYWNSSNNYFNISNNYINLEYGYYCPWNCQSYGYGIYINAAKNSNNARNYITNNTISRLNKNAGGYTYGLYLANVPTNSYVDVTNNLFVAEAAQVLGYGIIGSSNTGVITANFNYFSNVTTPFTSVVDDGSSVLTSNAAIDIDGKLSATCDAINGGNPDSVYYDIDLTRNDVGAYGGSFTLDNFFPVTGAARVFFIQAPRRVVVGNTIEVKAEAFDR